MPALGALVRPAVVLFVAIGAILLLIAEFSPLYEIRVITTVPQRSIIGSDFDPRPGAGSHHGYALLIIALAALVMLAGWLRSGARPAAAALVLLACAALFVCLAIDLPDVDEEGLIGELYDQAQASAKSGFYLETLGSVLLLIGGAGALLLGRRRGE